jgi:hypothetical protein
MLEFLKSIKDVMALSGEVLEKTLRSLSLTSNTKAAAKKSKKVAGVFEKLDNSITQLKYRSSAARVAIDSGKKAFSFIFSEKVAKIVGIGLAGFAFAAAAATPPVAVAMLAVSTAGFAAKVAGGVIQRRNFRKIQDEEKALVRLIQHKHKSIEIAHKIEKTHPGIKFSSDLAKSIGLSSLTLPDHSQEKLSKLDRAALIKSLQDKKLSPIARSALTKKLSLLDNQDISSQKYEEGRSTYGNAAKEVLKSGGLKLAGDLSTAAANIANPVGLAIAVVSSATGFISETRGRHEVSDQKQALKNSIELFRKRSDVPGYDNLAELDVLSRKAKLEAKALEKLSGNKDFIAALKDNDVTLLRQMVTTAKHQVTFEERALEQSKELKLLIKEKKQAVQKTINLILKERYDEYHSKATEQLKAHNITDPSEKQVLQAMKEIAKIEAKQTVELNRGFNKKETEAEIAAVRKGGRDYEAFRSSDKKADIIAEYESQGKQTRWQKFKKLMSDIGTSFNIFSREELTVKKPHRLLVAEHLSDFAIHKHEHSKDHQAERVRFDKQKQEVIKIHEHLMERSLLSPYAVSVRKIVAPSSTPVVSRRAALAVAP